MANYYPMLKYAGGGGGGGSLDGNATPSDVASGKTFYSNDGNTKETGTIPIYTGSVNCGFGTSTAVQYGYHGNGNVYRGPDLGAATSDATAGSGDIVEGSTGWAKGKYINGSLDESILMDYDGSNSSSDVEFFTNSFNVKNSANTLYTFSTNNSNNRVFTNGMRYWKKGVVNGTLVADSSHKIYFPKGAVFLMVTNAYNYNNGKVIGTKAYTITTNGGASSTTALAVPKLTAFAASGEPLKCTLGADTSGPAQYYDSDTLYAGYIIIGSCGTNCRVEYEIMPLLTIVT